MADQLQIVGARPLEVVPDAARERTHFGNEIDALGALRPRWRAIASLAAGASALAYLSCQLLTPLYAAKTSVMIDTRAPSPAASRTYPTAMPPSEETLRKNEIAIIRSRNLVDAIVARLLDQDPEFNPALAPADPLTRAKSALASLIPSLPGLGARTAATSGPSENQARENAIDIFLGKLSTTSSDASRVIEIRFLSEDPVRAAQIANTISDEYIKEKIQEQIAGPLSVADSLEQNIEALNRKIRDSERIIEETRNRSGLLPTANARVVVEQLAELNKRLALATGDRVGAEARLAELQAAGRSGAPDSAASVLGSPLIHRLQAEATLLAARIGQMSTTYGKRHPKLIEAEAELEDLRGRINAEVTKIASSYRNALAAAQSNEISLRQEVESLKTRVTTADMSAVDVRVLERGTEADKNLLTQLGTRLNDTKAQIKLQGPEAWVISRATVPRSPTFPPKLANVAAAFGFSMAGGAVLAVLLERRDGSIRSSAQIRQLTSASVLGAVPMLRGSRKTRRSPQWHVLTRRRSLFAENLRAAWFQLDNVRPVPAKVILITSSLPREGKSGIAMCLGRMMALSGRKVVVDADLRNSSVPRAYIVRWA